MLSFDPQFRRTLAQNTWPLYGVGAGFFVARTVARLTRLGFRRLQPDDFIMVAAFLCYTGLCVCLNFIAAGGGSNLFPPEEAVNFSEAEIEERAKGSKIVLISEQFMLNTIYLIKTCMLIMYTRLTTGLKQHKLVKAIAVWVGCGWVATEFTFFFACRPFSQYWAVPPDNPECTTFKNYAITQAIFNISADLMMLAIMLPLFVKAKLELKQKVALVFIFGMGSFVIVAAICTKVFNLSDVYSTVYMLWYFREASVAMYVSNIPLIWPLLREWVSTISRHASTLRGDTYASGSRPVGGSSNVPLSHMSKSSGRHHLSHHLQHPMGMETDIKPSESAERINRPPFQTRAIFTETTVEVAYDEDEDDDRASFPSSADATATTHAHTHPSDPSNFDIERHAPMRHNSGDRMPLDEKKPVVQSGLQRVSSAHAPTSGGASPTRPPESRGPAGRRAL